MAHWMIPLITATACLLGALRLACYCRADARYRPAISLMASALGATLCLSGLEILLYRPPLSLGYTATAATLCLLIFRARGNVAALWRPRS